MIKVYLNYPNARITIHHNPLCPKVRMQNKANQRVIHVSVDMLSSELQRFHTDQHAFGSEAAKNDMWVFDLDDDAFERAVVDHIQQVVGRRYTPLGEAQITTCCQAADGSSELGMPP